MRIQLAYFLHITEAVKVSRGADSLSLASRDGDHEASN